MPNLGLVRTLGVLALAGAAPGALGILRRRWRRAGGFAAVLVLGVALLAVATPRDRLARLLAEKRGGTLVLYEEDAGGTVAVLEQRPPAGEERMTRRLIVAITLLLTSAWPARAADPLPSWNDGAARQAIVDFVTKVTTTGGPDFVREAERIAVFDNDGTLWSEQPVYFQLAFALDRVQALAPQHPEWKEKQPFKAALEGDMKTLAAGGEHALLELVMASHANQTTDEFARAVEAWISTAKHPKTGRLYTQMVYKPMLELLAYLRANGFKTFIVSGGGIEFMRVFAERVYGVPPEQVIGSSIKTKFEIRNGEPVLVRLPEIDFIDDKAGKPVGIQAHVGRRPVAAFGNSDGDLQMLQWTAARKGASFCLYVHHTDGEREWAYDRESAIGRLDKGLDEARARGWTVVDVKNDWKVIYP